MSSASGRLPVIAKDPVEAELLGSEELHERRRRTRHHQFLADAQLAL